MQHELYTSIHVLKSEACSKLSSEKLAGYVGRLNSFFQNHPGSSCPFDFVSWSKHLERVYQELVRDAFSAFNVVPPEGMEMYLAGSVGRRQATPYSDIDAFVLFSNPEDSLKCAPVFEGINHLLLRIYFQTNQLLPDITGMSTDKLCGTIDQITKMLIDENNVLKHTAILSAVSSSNTSTLGFSLKKKLMSHPKLFRFYTPHTYYRLALKLSDPRQHKDFADIKKNLIYPVNFIVMALLLEHHLLDRYTPENRLALLKAETNLPDTLLNRLETTLGNALNLRLQLHLNSREDNDRVPLNNAHSFLSTPSPSAISHAKPQGLGLEMNYPGPLNEIPIQVLSLLKERDILRQFVLKRLTSRNYPIL